ncbi:MAG: deoxyribonuclease IV [Desulfobacterota bacterium]|nr:deoxyribonuclease IV [Thermodesulfobacteriota bacterium]MDW8001104.1 deoxyribonuclease IV [Deltaproteobacteria bacterium]
MRVKLGFHMSISSGFDKLYKEFIKLGCECLQIFVKNPRSWRRKEWKDEELEIFKKSFSSVPVFAHLSYLPNLARAEKKDVEAFMDEAETALRLGIKFIVVHCGSLEDKALGIRRVSESVNTLLEQVPIQVLLENSAGSGNSIGSNLEEIAKIYEKIKEKERVKLCIDTAHLFQAGINIKEEGVWEEFFESVCRNLGPQIVGLLHFNDSRTEMGSRVDRHWHIGLGKLGRRALTQVINDPRVSNLCAIMETPGMGMYDYENMKRAKSLLLPLMSHPLS